jgi:putative membrane protein
MRDVLLAWVHFLCIFALVSALVAELLLYRRTMDAARVSLLRGIDAGFGISAALVIASGLLRVFFGIKGAAFYAHDPVFWTKMALFAAVGLLSIPPTLHYLRLGRDGDVTVPDGAFRRTWAFLVAEVGLLAFIPLFATLLAHGY